MGAGRYLCSRYRWRYANANADRDSNGNSDGDAYCHSYRHSYGDTYRCTETYPATAAPADSAPTALRVLVNDSTIRGEVG